MGIVLGPNQYGKAENRVVRVYRDQPRHVMRDLNVSTSLRGEFSAAHTTGDQAHILPTDTQKNTAFAFAKQQGVDDIEDYALALARHFLNVPHVTSAQIEVDEYAWERIEVAGQGHDHAFVRGGQDTRTTLVTVERSADDTSAVVVSGMKDLVLLKTTGSEFRGFYTDEYTTLQPTDDRIMATSLTARWRYCAHRRRMDQDVRRHPVPRSGAFRHSPFARPAADALRHRASGARGAYRSGGDDPRRAQQAPLRGGPLAVRAGQPGRGLHRGRPAVRAHPGDRAPRRRTA